MTQIELYDKLPSELLYIIYNNLQTKEDIFTFRLLNNASNNIFTDLFNTLCIDNICAESTLVETNRCYTCDLSDTNYKYNLFIYNFESHPRRLLYYCNNVTCFFKCIKVMLDDIQLDNILPFYKANCKNILINTKQTDYYNDAADYNSTIQLTYAKVEESNIIYYKKHFYILIFYHDSFYKYEKFINIQELNVNFKLTSNLIFKWFFSEEYKKLYQ